MWVDKDFISRLQTCRHHKSHESGWFLLAELNRSQWRIQDFPQGGAPTPKIAIIFQIFVKNCMKMKEF